MAYSRMHAPKDYLTELETECDLNSEDELEATRRN